MAHYTSDKRPADLDAAAALADADVMVVQKDGENFTRKVPYAVIKADMTGVVYFSDTVALVAGAQIVPYSGSFVLATVYQLFIYTRNAQGYEVAFPVPILNLDGFGINVPEACDATYYAVPKL